MPNGGIDNCSTCCFNQANEGQIGHHNPDGDQLCNLREFEISNPYYTYCSNHPMHNPDRIEIPVGPVVQGSSRKFLRDSPDTPEIRETLLKILNEIPEVPRSDWLTTNLEDDAIQQLGGFCEARARDGLLRVAGFDPFSSPAEDQPNASGRTKRSRIWTVTTAIEALARVAGDEVTPFVRHFLTPPGTVTYNGQKQWPPEIRYRCLVALRYCTTEKAKKLLELAMEDVDPIIKNEAAKLLQELVD